MTTPSTAKKLHPLTQINVWADAYEKEGGHALIVQMLRSYAALAAQPQAVAAPEPDPEAWRIRYRSEPGMIGHYPWSYTGRKPRMLGELNHEVEPLYTASQVQAMLARGMIPLTKSQITQCAWGYFEDSNNLPEFVEHFVGAIEAAHGITASPAPKCLMCSDHGLIGGMTIEGGESWPCPDCNSPDPARALLQEALTAWDQQKKWNPNGWIERVRVEMKGGV